MPLSLRQIRLVQHVAREGTLTAAARTLHLTQSALSHQLTKLEGQLKVPAFTRTGKTMVPTAAGLRILESAEAILGAVEELDADLRRIALGRTGLIRLTASCYTCYHWLPDVLPAFRAAYPDVEVTLVPECSARALSALHEGEVDLILSYQPLEDEASLDALPLFEDEQVLVVPPEHRLATRAWVEARDFEGEHLLVHYRPAEESLFYRSVLAPAGVAPARVSEVRLTEGILSLVAAGAGVAVVTRWTAAPEIAARRVVPVRIGRSGLHREWKAVRLRAEWVPKYLDEFRALLQRGPDRLFDGAELAPHRENAGIVLRAMK